MPVTPPDPTDDLRSRAYVVRERAEKLRAELAEGHVALHAIAVLRHLHRCVRDKELDLDMCVECQHEYPCRTIQALPPEPMIGPQDSQ